MANPVASHWKMLGVSDILSSIINLQKIYKVFIKRLNRFVVIITGVLGIARRNNWTTQVETNR